MPFSIQTNVNSLIAQENLRVNTNFQNQTIQRLTSGYRINSSGDDAAGLAIANKFRNDTAELTQGVRNANDGISALQIIDGGMNNISKMLDRLKTLATQSASATFTGDRSVLNSEYQSLVTEIDRQAQSVGLSTGGHFVARMGVYVGGGANAAGTADTANGTIELDLSASAVDTKALGLRTSDFEVATKSTADIGSGSATSVATIATANSADAGMATFSIAGPGFSGVQLGVNISGLTTPASVADTINAAIAVAGNSNTSFRDAGIAASV
ncbi:MAG: flagellin, partial [Acidobacteria bacterium]|nr:flagellin [Acidobacteriota bacterium]